MEILGNRLLVSVDTSTQKTHQSGLIIPYDTNELEYMEGVVKQIGSKVSDLKEKNIVLFTKDNLIKLNKGSYIVPYDNIFLSK